MVPIVTVSFGHCNRRCGNGVCRRASARGGRGRPRLQPEGHPPPAPLARRLQGQESLRRRVRRHRVSAGQPLRPDPDRIAHGSTPARACSSWRSIPAARTRSSASRRIAQERSVPFPVLKDFDQQVADAFGAKRTPEVVPARRQPGDPLPRPHRRPVRRRLPPRQADAAATSRQALDELLAGKPITTPRTEVIGLPDRTLAEARMTAQEVTYAKHVAPDPPETLPGMPPAGRDRPVLAVDL